MPFSVNDGGCRKRSSCMLEIVVLFAILFNSTSLLKAVSFFSIENRFPMYNWGINVETCIELGPD